MKKIVGLDIGTNSIGWAIIDYNFKAKKGKILGSGSRIIPMDQGSISDFNSGTLQSPTAQRTQYRGVRRLQERKKLRRERLLRVLHVCSFLPPKFTVDHLTSLPYYGGEGFRFIESHQELLVELQSEHSQLINIPHDWTLYHLRVKALSSKISKEELAWVLLSFNQKRGYFELKDENLESGNGKYFVSDTVVDIVHKGEWKGKNRILEISLSEGIVGTMQLPYIPKWINQKHDFIVTEKLLKDGSNKVTITRPDEDDWTLRKKKIEQDLNKNNQTVAQKIVDAWKKNPSTKIRGNEIHTVDRKYYRAAAIRILEEQLKHHPELADDTIKESCIHSLYKSNTARQKELAKKTLAQIIVDDILFYQRPLKTKRHLIANCKHEVRYFKKDYTLQSKPIKVTAKSHPAFQEYRIWNYLHNLRIIKNKGKNEKGHLVIDQPMDSGFISFEDKASLFALFDSKKEVSEAAILKILNLSKKEYSTNQGDRKLHGNVTKAAFLTIFKKADALKTGTELLSDKNRLVELWNLLYSHRLKSEKAAIIKALQADKYGFYPEQAKVIADMPLFKKEYGAMSVKALNKLLPIVRCLSDVTLKNEVDNKTEKRIEDIINGEVNNNIDDHIRETFTEFTDIEQFQGLPPYLAEYIVYNRHSEKQDTSRYLTPEDIKRIPQHSLRNPIVEQVVNETLMVVKDIWSEYGRPDEIHVELGREMKNNAKKRKEITTQRDSNERTNKRIKQMLSELMKDPTIEGEVNPYSIGQSEMLKLYEEGAIASAGKTIDPEILTIYKSNEPTSAQLHKYKLWLDQKYISPYTGATISLSKLFTPAYEIEHVIPKSKYYDNSFSNKIICEARVNKDKGDSTAYAYIDRRGGEMIPLGNGQEVRLYTKSEYEKHVSSVFRGKKLKMLLSHDIPDGFINRQLNDTRYISKKIFELLDPIVREENDRGSRSKKLIPVVGKITSDLKRAWGLNDLWKSLMVPRFQRLNEIHETDEYCQRDAKGKYHLKYDLSGGLKRIDHRHHALDAIAIACTSWQHIQYLNALNNDIEKHALQKSILRYDKQNRKQYLHPWEGFYADTKKSIEDIIISFKYDNRIINRTKNTIQKWNADGTAKIMSPQEANRLFWSIRQPLHKESIYGRIKQKEYKSVPITKAIEILDQIATKAVREQLQKRLKEYGGDLKKAKKSLKAIPISINEEEILKTDIVIWNDQISVKRAAIDESFSLKNLESVSNTGIRKILRHHLNEYDGDTKLAFGEEGLQDMNSKLDIPIYKVRLKEALGKKRSLGKKGNNPDKYVVAATGTNLFFVIYKNRKTGEHMITKESSVSFLDALACMKDGLPVAVEKEGYDTIILSPGDLVYLPSDDKEIPQNIDKARIYKMVSYGSGMCYFHPQSYALPFIDKELGSQNKSEWDIDKTVMIKKHCLPLKVNRLGKVIR